MNPPNTYCVISYNPRRRVCFGDDDKHEYFYRWYWQADFRSWVDHHLFGMSCNTYVNSDMADKVKLRTVVWK